MSHKDIGAILVVHSAPQKTQADIVGYFRRNKLVIVKEDWRDRMLRLEQAINDIVEHPEAG